MAVSIAPPSGIDSSSASAPTSAFRSAGDSQQATESASFDVGPLGPEHADLLGTIDLFASLDEVALAQLAAYMDVVTLANGSTACKQGDRSDALFVVASGTFAVLVEPAGYGEAAHVGTLSRGDYFGEMGLLTGEPRSATVRSLGVGRLLRLEQERFLTLVQRHPKVATTIVATLSRRLRAANQVVADGRTAVGWALERSLDQLPEPRRRRALEASILDDVSSRSLWALFGTEASQVAQDLARLGAGRNDPMPATLEALREVFRRETSTEHVQAWVAESARALAAVRQWDEALSLLHREGLREEYIATLGRALRGTPTLGYDQQVRWVETIGDDEAARDVDLVLAKASLDEARGDRAAASRVLHRALDEALAAQDSAAVRRLTEKLASRSQPSLTLPRGTPRRESPSPVSALDFHRRTVQLVTVATAGLTLGAAAIGDRQLAFILLLGAAVVLWVSNLLPSSSVALALTTAWIILGIARPAEAVAGFGTMSWIFVVAILAIAAGVTRSGLLFRLGLMLVRRLPHGLFWQAGVLMLTCIALGPLMPLNNARAALTAPLAVAVADALRLRDREPATAVLGLAVWIGVGPLAFVFLNATPYSILAWGLLPESSRQHFDWTGWFTAALPLGAMLAAGALVSLFLLLRPPRMSAPSQERVDVQLLILGSLSRRETAMVVVLLLTLIGWIVAPSLGIDFGTIALLGLLAATVTGNLNRQSLQEMDWNFVILFGVAISLGQVAANLGLERTIGAMIGTQLSHSGASPVVYVFAIAILAMLTRLFLFPTEATLLLTLVLVPLAPSMGIDPWVAVITVLAVAQVWHLPSQNLAYLMAFSASDGRLYTPAQSRMVAFVYVGLTLVALGLTIPYWHLLGLL